MSCGCAKPEKAVGWTPIPEYRQPTDIQPGENIECYMKRAGNTTGLMDDNSPMTPDRIDNTSLTSDLSLNVNVKMKLTDGSIHTSPTWSMEIKENGTITSIVLDPSGTLTIDSSTGVIAGKIHKDFANRTFKVLITAKDGTTEIDSREFNFYPKTESKDDTKKFVMPLDGDIRVTCKFGPRCPPATGASSNHKGMDFARKDHSLGNILAASDGTIVRCGPGSGWGNVIFIEHNDAQGRLVATTVYGHWSEAYVKVGQKVAGGQAIAKEGNVGIGSGAHLHFEMHKGKFGNPTDPAPYLLGATPSGDPVKIEDVGSTTPVEISNTNTGMTTGEATNSTADCPGSTSGNPLPQALNNNPEHEPPLPTNNKNKYRSACAIGDPPSPADVKAIILAECSSAGLTAEEANFILTVATIESGLDPAAKNPTSSATGLYQMLDKIAITYFGQLNMEASCENRCDAAKATKAMILFFKNEFRPYYAGYINSGKTKIANKTIQDTAWSQKYPTLSMGEFMYGLIHHDGVGTAVSGVDKGGVAYWQSKVKSA